ncbi:bcl2-associated agonist of cell death [Gastrophryne carolinensis]
MAEHPPRSMFSIEDFSATGKGSALPGINPPSYGEDTKHKSSPNPRRMQGREPRLRTESASEAQETDHVGELPLFRLRSRSAPSSLMVAARYGRELRRMSDEFDQIFTNLPRPKSAGAATEMTGSRSFKEMFMGLWRKKSKDKCEGDDEKH